MKLVILIAALAVMDVHPTPLAVVSAQNDELDIDPKLRIEPMEESRYRDGNLRSGSSASFLDLFLSRSEGITEDSATSKENVSIQSEGESVPQVIKVKFAGNPFCEGTYQKDMMDVYPTEVEGQNVFTSTYCMFFFCDYKWRLTGIWRYNEIVNPRRGYNSDRCNGYSSKYNENYSSKNNEKYILRTEWDEFELQ